MTLFWRLARVIIQHQLVSKAHYSRVEPPKQPAIYIDIMNRFGTGLATCS